MDNIEIIYEMGELVGYAFLPQDEYDYILIICHGFRGAKENGGKIFGFAEKVNQLGVGVIAFDFCGSGASSGQFEDITLTGQIADLGRVIDYVGEHYQKEVILLGRSLGGSTVLASAAVLDKKVAGYVLWSAPFMLYETFSELVSAFAQNQADVLEIGGEAEAVTLKRSFVEDFASHDLKKCAQKLANHPVLIIHGGADEVVDSINAVRLYENCRTAELHIVSAADHRFTRNTAEREALTLNWIKKISQG